MTAAAFSDRLTLYQRHAYSVASGLVAEVVHRDLIDRARQTLPPMFQELIRLTPEPLVTAICDLAIPRMVFQSRAVLIGDAAILVRLHNPVGNRKSRARCRNAWQPPLRARREPRHGPRDMGASTTRRRPAHGCLEPGGSATEAPAECQPIEPVLPQSGLAGIA